MEVNYNIEIVTILIDVTKIPFLAILGAAYSILVNHLVPFYICQLSVFVNSNFGFSYCKSFAYASIWTINIGVLEQVVLKDVIRDCTII